MNTTHQVFSSQPSAKSEFSQFLYILFDELERSALQYAVMRNYEGLPTSLSGNDLDIIVRREDLEQHRRLLAKVAESAEWNLIYAVDRIPISVYKFVKLRSPHHLFPPVLRLDYFPGEYWQAVQLMPSENLLKYRETYGTIQILNPLGRVLCLVLHHLLWSARLGRKKYHEDIRAVLSHHYLEFQRNLNAILGANMTTRLIHTLTDTIEDRGPLSFRDIQWHLRRAVLFRSISKKPLEAFIRWVHLASQEFSRYIRPAGLLVSVWSQQGLDAARIAVSKLMPWLWLLDARSHAFIGSYFNQLIVSPDQDYCDVIPLQYGFCQSQGKRPSYNSLVWRLRSNLSRGRIVVLADEGNFMNLKPFVQVDVCILLINNPEDAAVKHKVRALQNMSTTAIIVKSEVDVELLLARHIAHSLIQKNKRNGWI